MGIGIAAIFLLTPIGIAVLVVVVVLRLSRQGRGGRQEAEQEHGMIQGLHTDLERMEKRIESLETILVEEIRKRQSAPPEDTEG
jgi:phage shock protein B